MKTLKLKFIALAILVLGTFGFIACSDEGNTVNSVDSNTTNFKISNELERDVVAVIVDNQAVPLYDEIILKEMFVNRGLFREVKSIDLVYGFNSEEDNYEAFLTIVAKEEINSSLVAVAIEADLILDGDHLIIGDPEVKPYLFTKHECKGYNCLSCTFKREGFLGLRIVGCNPCGGANQPEEPSGCNHSSSSGGGSAVKEAVNLIKMAAF